MKTATLQGQFSLRCLDQRQQDPLILDKKKMLIGSHEHCDFRLQDKSISSYHAFFFINGSEGFVVKDLCSESGVFVNGKRVEESFVNPNDVITIGTMSFSIEFLEDAVPAFNLDEAIEPTVEKVESVELPERPGLIFIDGEYCDIQFDETHYRPLTKIPEVNFKGEFIELEQTQEILPITQSVKDKRLEVISYMNGMILDIKYLTLSNGDYFLDPNPKGKNAITFHTLVKTKIFSIDKGSLKFYPNEHITPSSDWDKINLGESLFLTHGAEQVSLRLIDHATGWHGLPFLYRDREFYKQSSQVFAMVFLPLLMLLFIEVHRPELPKEEIAVVYKLPTKVPEPQVKPDEALTKEDVSAIEVTQTQENTGHKETDQPKEKVEFAEASQKQKVVAKMTTPKPAKVPAPAEKPTQTAAAPKPVPTPPVKSYEFKSSVAMGSLVADAPKLNVGESGGKSAAVQDTSFNAGSADDGRLVASANIGVSKFNGSDKKGSGQASYGSKGLASKKGFDSSYLEPKTVVLGSMDPELLRKILQEYIPQFRACYQDELIGKSEKIKGVIDLNFTISANGKVSKFLVKVKDAQFSKKGQGCMGQVLGLIDFPKPKGGGVVDVKQPLNFFSETEKI